MPDRVSSDDCCHLDSDCREGMPERHKIRTEPEKKALMRRLSIIDGQIRGIQGMVERDVYCVDILTQVSAVNCALNSFSKELLASHMRNCVAADLKQGDDEKMEELIRVLHKLMK